MVDSRLKLTVLHDDAGSFSNHSEDLCDFSRDAVTMALNASDDYLYLGYYKPVNAVYFEFTTPNTNANTLTVQAYNGSSWATITARDETRGFTRSGYLTFDRDDLNEVTVNGTAACFIRIRPSVTHSSTVMQAANIVFSDDNMLKNHFPEITDSSLLASGQSTHILAHVGARDEIIQELRNRGYVKTNDATGDDSITAWDMLDIFEVQQASVYKALANIFFSLADGPEDKWYVQHVKYADLYQRLMNGLKLSVDSNDDGVKDDEEKQTKIRSTRLVY